MRKYQQEANEIARSLKVKKRAFMFSKEWRALRKEVIQHYGGTCMRCGCLPSKKRKPNVDHIKPRKLFPELALEFDNLQVLCGRCNKEKGNTVADYRGTVPKRTYLGATLGALDEDCRAHILAIVAA